MAIMTIMKYSNGDETTSRQTRNLNELRFLGMYRHDGWALIAKSIHCFCNPSKQLFTRTLKPLITLKFKGVRACNESTENGLAILESITGQHINPVCLAFHSRFFLLRNIPLVRSTQPCFKRTGCGMRPAALWQTVPHTRTSSNKTLAVYVLWIRGTTQVLSTVDLRRRRPLLATRLTSSVQYAGTWPWPDNDWCTRHTTLYSTRRRTGSQYNWTSTCEMWPYLHRLAPVICLNTKI